MLLRFRISNYRSFKNDTILDLTATDDNSFENTLMSCGHEKILPVSAVYGANAGGKSNLVKAFQIMATIVQQSNEWRDEKIDGRTYAQTLMADYAPFAFDSTTDKKETLFEVWFTIESQNNEIIYNYGFTWDVYQVKEEWLNIQKRDTEDYQQIFHRRHEDNVEFFSELIPAEDQSIISRSLERQVLVVSFGSTLKIDILQKIYNFFLMLEVKHAHNGLRIKLPRDFKIDPSVRSDVLQYLQSFDDSIIDFQIDDSLHMREPYRNVFTIHKTNDSNHPARLPLEEESDGTIKMFNLYQNMTDALNYGTILWIDELNSQLHPLLVRYFLQNFIDPAINKKHAQLIFTTHDPWLLGNGMLRKDEIWFVEKDSNGVSDLYSLSDFEEEEVSKLFNTENYEENYLMGRYGAIPNLVRHENGKG